MPIIRQLPHLLATAAALVPESTLQEGCPAICSNAEQCRVGGDYAAIYNMSDSDRVCYHACSGFGWCGATLEHFVGGINCCGCAPPGTDFSLSAGYDGECSTTTPSPQPPPPPEPTCPDICSSQYECRVGDDYAAVYNMQDSDRVCYHSCSVFGWCGVTHAHFAGGTNCCGCAPSGIDFSLYDAADYDGECSAPPPPPEKQCEDYFGSLDGIFTVADPDVGITPVSTPYCEGSGIFGRTCTYMHLAGHSCVNPAPPDGCHHYHKVQYSECPELAHFNHAYDDNTRIDTTGAFNGQGVFVACADRVMSNEVFCFGPPADSPVQCVCSSDPQHPEPIPENMTPALPDAISAVVV